MADRKTQWALDTPKSELVETALVDVLASLGATLERADDLTRRAAHLLSLSTGRDERNLRALAVQLSAVERERSRLRDLLAESEGHRTKLIASYVATYQLHSTLDPAEVQAALVEIVTSVVGVESFALLLRVEGGGGFRVALVHGDAAERLGADEGTPYAGKDPLIERSIENGELLMGPISGSKMLAAVPLTSQGVLVGVLVLSKLLAHRKPLGGDDRDLLDLVAAHAASALLASSAFATSERKRKTLEGLVELARGR